MEFTEIKKQALREWQKLEQSNIPVFLIGTATCGRSAGALDVWASLEKVLDQNKIKARVIEVGCIGLCFAEPLVTVIKPGRPGICYGQVTGEKITEIIQKYLIDNDPLAEYALGTVGRAGLDNIPRLFEIPVFQLQVRRVLRNCGFIDPNNINHYIARGGYGGFIKALKLKPQDVIEQIKESGLRGRGGAGFPTWRKWQFCRKAKSSKKYLICNADEGDPGAFMDRSVLEGDPHSVLEGMLIAAYAIGAQESYIYCRAEYPLALERLRSAIKQMEDNGL
ncbi:MAG: NADH-quinone oxidoreductase subunit F, partial [Candidatus Omnitrophica bacterium]|nr:NADH-quinone oxidoreductase subunit F [Candidatus Omnitrophota bacterium]